MGAHRVGVPKTIVVDGNIDGAFVFAYNERLIEVAADVVCHYVAIKYLVCCDFVAGGVVRNGCLVFCFDFLDGNVCSVASRSLS